MSTGVARAVERVAKLCDALHEDARTLRLELLEEVRRVVPFDAYSWLLTDPQTQVGSAPLADVPCLPELPRLIRLKYLTPVNRWTSLHAPAGLHAATNGRREDSRLWREMLRGYGVDDVLSQVFRDRFGCWGFLELWRIGSGPHFNEDDIGFFAATADSVTRAIRGAQAKTFAVEPAVAPRRGPVVLVLSPDLAVRAQTPDTEEHLRVLVPPDEGRRPVPSGAYNVSAQLLAVEAGVDSHEPWARVHLSGGLWLTMRAARIGASEGGSDQDRDIAVTIETSTAAERLELFVRAFGLSPREAELLSLLVAGSDTREVADQMFLSRHTVQDHLKAIFAKTGTRNRRTLLASVLGR